jgi:hypothetical protein
MGWIVRDRVSLGRRKEWRFLSDMPPDSRRLEWTTKARDALFFNEEDASAIVDDLNRRHPSKTHSVRKVRQKATTDLVWLNAKTREVVIGPQGQRERARPGCNRETGELF